MSSSLPNSSHPSRANGSGDTGGFDAHRRLLDICRGLSVGPNIAAAFIDDYLRMLDERIERIDRDLVSDDRDEAVVALLSLDSSSTMLGAYALSDVAQRLRARIEDGSESETGVAEDVGEMHRQATRTRSELLAVRELVS